MPFGSCVKPGLQDGDSFEHFVPSSERGLAFILFVYLFVLCVPFHPKLVQSVFCFLELIGVRSYSFGAGRIIFLCSHSLGASVN